jgi:hypothetical protein
MTKAPARRLVAAMLFAVLGVSTFACSIPNLEKPECTEARLAVKEFYSYHFGNDMAFTPENVAAREKFLTPEFAASLNGKQVDGDPFTTGTHDIPKAFRVGGCEVTPQGGTRLEILLFWKDNVRSEQRKIFVDAVKRGDNWLVDKISGQ